MLAQFFVGLAVFLAVRIAYLLFFVQKQRYCVGLMLSLGAGRRKTRAFCWSISMVPIGIAVTLGSACGSLGMNRVLRELFGSLFEDVATLLDTTGIGPAMVAPIRLIPVSAALQLLLCITTVAFWVEYHLKKKPLALMKNMK